MIGFLLCHALVASSAITGTFTVTETWSVTLYYDDFGNGFSGTRHYSGTQTGTIRISNGEYDILDRTGVQWASPGHDLKGRTLTFNGFSYEINGDYAFAPGFGASAYGLVFLGCFAVKVPLVDGEVPAFYRFETYSASGSDLSSIEGGGNMIGESLEAHVSSTVSLKEIVGAPQIVQQPRSQSLFEGQTATLSVVAAGKSPLMYFWRKGASGLPGANGASLTITNLQLADAGAYSVVVSNAGGKVTSAAAQLTVRLPPPPWFEGWESSIAGVYAPSSNDVEVAVRGDKGHWVIVDTVSFFPECYPIGNHADVVIGNGRKSLRLASVPNNGGCAENISVEIDGRTSTSFPIPLLPGSEVSFFAQGSMVNPLWNGFFQCIDKPCGDTTHLRIVDDHNNQVIYILQRAPNYVEHALTNGPSNFGYREIFLDPAGGIFTRNLYEDLASVAGSAGVGTAVTGLGFALSAAGWAELDDLRIGSASGTSDRAGPTIAIGAPVNKSRLFLPNVTLTGTARDGVAVERVEVRVGDGPYQNAIGAVNWAANLELSPGTNVIRARARDTSGNYSAEAVWSLVYVVTSPLTLVVSPGGKVIGAMNGQSLEVGRAYLLTVMPAPGFLFSNWTGGLISSANPLKFVMTSNLVLEANCVPNPFLPIAGSFNGLFRETGTVEHGSSGAFKAAIQGSGAYSASLQTGTRKLAFAGRFGLDGKSTNTVARSGANALTVELCLQFGANDELIGRVTDGNWTSDLIADRAVFNALNPATNFARQYTLLIPGGTNGSQMEPAGDGFATVALSRAGVATFKHTLADGTTGVLAVPLSRNGDTPWYIPLYGGRGSALGWLRFGTSANPDLGGNLVWFKPVGALPALYTNGFVLESRATASGFTPIRTNHLFEASSATVQFAEGGLTNPLAIEVALGPSGQVRADVTNKLAFKTAAATGLFSGTVVLPGGTRPIPFKGILLQRQGYGSGYFTNAGQSGRWWISP